MSRVFSRAEKIRVLVTTDIEANGGEANWFIQTLLENGWEGYHNMSDEQIDKMFDENCAELPEDRLERIIAEYVEA